MPTLRSRKRRGQRIGALQPLAFAQVAVHLRQLAHGGDQQAQRQVGDFAGEHVGRVRHHDAALGQLGRVDVVVADAEAGDDLQLGEAIDEGAVDARVAAADGYAAHLRVGLAQHGEVVGDALFNQRHGVAHGEYLDVLAHLLLPFNGFQWLSRGTPKVAWIFWYFTAGFSTMPFGQFVDDAALDLLPRRLARRVRVAAGRLQRGAALRQFLVADTACWRVRFFRSMRTLSPVFSSARPPPVAASGEAFRIDGEPRGARLPAVADARQAR